MPAYGGNKCDGTGEEYAPCEELKPCPINCGLSQWGAWTSCSISCGQVGQGIMERHRHIANEAKYGGRPCPAGSMRESVSCHHKTNTNLTNDESKLAITHCPIDCEFGRWYPWDNCRPFSCFGEKTGFIRDSDYIQGLTTNRYRPIKQQALFGGEKCEKGADKESKKCDYSDVPDCDKVKRVASRWSSWGEWSDCMAPCGQRGSMTRSRYCVYGEDGNPCKGEDRDSRQCPNHCPPGKYKDNCFYTYHQLANIRAIIVKME